MSEWNLVLLRNVLHYLERISPNDRQRILDVLKLLQENPSSVPIKSLKGRPEKSIRVGDYRILLRFDVFQQSIVVMRIGPRGDIYKK